MRDLERLPNTELCQATRGDSFQESVETIIVLETMALCTEKVTHEESSAAKMQSRSEAKYKAQ